MSFVIVVDDRANETIAIEQFHTIGSLRCLRCREGLNYIQNISTWMHMRLTQCILSIFASFRDSFPSNDSSPINSSMSRSKIVRILLFA